MESATEKTYPSLSEIRSALPDEVFESSVIRSLSYVVFDTLVIGLLVWGQIQLHGTEYFFIAYPAYAFLLGTMMWAYFVLGHGRFLSFVHSFSLSNKTVQTVGIAHFPSTIC